MSRTRRLAVAVASAYLLAGAAPASAGLFDDDEARRQISDMRSQTNDRLDTQSKAQLDLANQIESLRDEIARLRGQIETLNYELEATKKRQQDFYVDLDDRLRKVEAAATAGSGAPAANGRGADAAPGTTTPPATARRPSNDLEDGKEYEAALNLFKTGKYKEAAASFAGFVHDHPDSDLAPSAQYWLGNAYYGLRDCKDAAAAHKVVATRWPDHPKAPDALLNMAACQQELGNAKGARQTLELLANKYPGTPAGDAAKKRLKK